MSYATATMIVALGAMQIAIAVSSAGGGGATSSAIPSPSPSPSPSLSDAGSVTTMTTTTTTPLLLAGNAIPGAEGIVTALLASTTAAWCFVPGLITAELASAMPRPRELSKSVAAAGTATVAVMLGVGTSLALCWGGGLTNPITISSQWEAATSSAVWGASFSRAFNALLLVANFGAYMLDSVQLGQWSCRRFCPSLDIATDWSVRAVSIYFLCTLPTFVGGFLLSVLVPNLFLMLAYSTAITVALCNMVFPALCYLALAEKERKGASEGTWRNRAASSGATGTEPNAGASVYDASGGRAAGCDDDDDGVGGDDGELESGAKKGLSKVGPHVDADKGWAVPLAWMTIVFGVAMTLVCMAAAVGMTVIPELRGKSASFC